MLATRTFLLRRMASTFSTAAITFAAVAVWSSAGPTAASAASSCLGVSAQEVSSVLGVKVGKVSTQVNGSVTVCNFQVGANSHGAYVRTQGQVTKSAFAANMKLAKTYGENPKNIALFKPYTAFSTSLGSATYGFTYGVTILKKSTQLDVGGVDTRLAKVETLAKKILPTI